MSGEDFGKHMEQMDEARRMLDAARARLRDGETTCLTTRDRVLLILADGEWHGTDELAKSRKWGGAGHRFGAGICQLRKRLGDTFITTEYDHNSPRGEAWFRYRLTGGAM